MISEYVLHLYRNGGHILLRVVDCRDGLHNRGIDGADDQGWRGLIPEVGL